MNKAALINIFRNNTVFHLAIIILLPVLIYIQSLKFDYTNFDDNGLIKDKIETVKNIRNIDTTFKTDAFWNKTGDFYRPVQNISFMLDAQVSGEKLWMFHITNLLIHILTCISFYYFLQFLQLKKYTAFVIALLFAVHPLFASGVGWIPSRGDILIGLFGLQLFLTFGLYYRTGKIVYMVLHILLFCITVFTKETTVLFPVFFIYYYFLILKERFSLRKALPFAIGWTASIVIFYILRKNVVAASGATADVLGIIPFFKNNQVIPTIIGKLFIPFNLSTFPLYNNASTITGLLFLLVLLYLTFEYSKEKRWAALMGLLWFLLFAIPPTIYRLENADVFFNYLEHRTYLPMIGIFIIIGFFLDDHLASSSFNQKFAWVYIPVIAIFSVLAWRHCADYKDTFAIRARAAMLDNPSALAARAGEWLTKKDTTLAMADINKAIELNPQDAGMYLLRAKIMARLQNHEAAEQDFTLALNLMPRLMEAYLYRSVERRFLKKYESAYRDVFMAASIDSANPKIYFTLGNLHIATKNYDEAINSFAKAISIDSNYADAYNNRAYIKVLSADYLGAIADANKALMKMKQPSPITYNNLGQAYRELNQPDSAFKYFDKAIEINKNFKEAYFERGRSKQKQNNIAGACKDWQQAASLGYADSTRMLEKYCK